MQKNFFIALLALLVCVLTALVLMQRRQLDSAAVPTPVEAAPPVPAPGQVRAPVVTPVRPPPAQPVVAPASARAAPPEAQAAVEPPNLASAMGEFAAMMEQPEVREMMRSQQKLMMDQMYGELFRDLGLSGDDLSAFKDLLVNKLMAGMDAGMGMFSASASSEDWADTAQRVKASSDELNERIKEFLGESEFEVYQQFEETIPDRMQVDLFKQSLSDEDQPGWQEQHELVLAMHEERTGFQYLSSADPAQMMNPGSLNDEAIQALLSDTAELHERYLDRAAEILTPVQLEHFQATLDQALTMQKTSMEMATRMFGGGGGQTP